MAALSLPAPGHALASVPDGELKADRLGSRGVRVAGLEEGHARTFPQEPCSRWLLFLCVGWGKSLGFLEGVSVCSSVKWSNDP